ncbi:MAG TPA: DUF3187 family protein [Nitrospirota bacterium]|nr:DUF3187 family protein [Nitrospirota bacterium]
MKNRVCLVPAVLMIFLLCSVPAFAFDGPLQVKNQFPIFLPINQPYLEQASTESSFSLNLSHSSVFVMEDSAHWTAHLDLELTELNLRCRKDIPALFEVGVDIPVLRATPGFMDRPLEWYHETFGFPDYGRNTRPQNEFLYDVKKDGAPLIEGDSDRVGFGDVRLTLKKKISGIDPVLSVLVDVELPTGNARIGYGSGSIDSAIAVLLDKDLGSETRLYANLGAVFPGDLKAHQTVKLDNFFYVGTGAEALIWLHCSLLGQIMVQTSPFPHTGISQIDNTAVIVMLGGRYYIGTGSFELSLTEDPNTSGAPDFILNFSYKKRF